VSVVADLCALAGVACILTGVWWLFPPAAVILAGLFLIAFAGIWHGRPHAR
jgi:hypothetical protein